MTKLKLRLMMAHDVFMRRIFGKAEPVRKTWQDMPAKFDDLVEFMNWFDATDSLYSTVQTATQDWELRFRRKGPFDAIKKNRSLEIGFGGGRLLARAALDFNEACGVDIHRAFTNTKKYLFLQGVENVQLFHRDDLAAGLQPGSVDFVYSFIVFQHFDSVEEVRFYLNQIETLLMADGIAHIYYGKRLAEGVQEVSDKDFVLRDCSLFINPTYMRDMVGEQFDILEYEDALPKNPETGEGNSGQARIMFRKRPSGGTVQE